LAASTAAPGDASRPASSYAVTLENLSMTGLLFVSQLPYRVGVNLEVEILLPGDVLCLPVTIRRIEQRTQRVYLGMPRVVYACGVSFRHAVIPATTRRKLMELLVRRSFTSGTPLVRTADACDHWPGDRPL
jgi:hypothetical protein